MHGCRWVGLINYSKIVKNMDSYSFVPGQPLQVTAEMKRKFEEDGYIIVR